MKITLRKTIIGLIAAIIPSTMAFAQPQQGQRPEFGGGKEFSGEKMPMPSVDELAQRKADAMNQELALTEKQDKKLKNILTPGQYDLWRSKHPAGRLPMPEPDLR